MLLAVSYLEEAVWGMGQEALWALVVGVGCFVGGLLVVALVISVLVAIIEKISGV